MATKAKFHETEAVLRATLARGDVLRGPHLQKSRYSAAEFASAMRYSANSSPGLFGWPPTQILNAASAGCTPRLTLSSIPLCRSRKPVCLYQETEIADSRGLVGVA